jgi:peptide/nickel transport system permease protein
MAAFILRRIAQAVLVMLTVGLIAFSLFRFVGDPVAFMLGQDATPEQRIEVTRALGLDRPFYVQYLRFLGNALQGEFGLSLRQVQPVSKLIVERLPATLELSIAAALFALLLGIPMGVYTALRRDSWLSHVLLAVSLAGVSLPTFLIGILLILVFSVQLGWMPSFGRGDTVALGWWTTGLLTASGLKALVLPAITLGLFQMTLIQRLVRSEMLEVLRTDYIRFARARGLTDRAVHFGHALKNTLVPVITITGLQLGAIIAFAIITETVFQWPGHGAALHPGGELRRRAGDGGVPVPDRAVLRRDQPGGRSPLLCGRSPPALEAAMTSPVDRIRRFHPELTAIRRDLHAHPELSFTEERTSKVVAEYLRKLGIETHVGLAKTGVVGVIPGKTKNGKAIGLRADMDCLPMHELNSFPHKSIHEGRMHACGHDGHTTMLLGTARYLAETRNFAGTAYLIFQPAEEGGGGGQVMVKEGLFERFPPTRCMRCTTGPACRPARWR